MSQFPIYFESFDSNGSKTKNDRFGDSWLGSLASPIPSLAGLGTIAR